MTMPADDRPGLRRSRRSVDAPATLRRGRESWPAGVLDLSVSGVRLRRPAGFEASSGEPLQFELATGGGALCTIEARVARLSREELALAFEHLGADSERRLHEFIERAGLLLDAIDRD